MRDELAALEVRIRFVKWECHVVVVVIECGLTATYTPPPPPKISIWQSANIHAILEAERAIVTVVDLFDNVYAELGL